MGEFDDVIVNIRKHKMEFVLGERCSSSFEHSCKQGPINALVSILNYTIYILVVCFVAIL